MTTLSPIHNNDKTTKETSNKTKVLLWLVLEAPVVWGIVYFVQVGWTGIATYMRNRKQIDLCDEQVCGYYVPALQYRNHMLEMLSLVPIVLAVMLIVLAGLLTAAVWIPGFMDEPDHGQG